MGVTTIITMECNECGLLLDGGYDNDVNARLAALAAGWENVGEGWEDEWWLCQDCLKTYREDEGEPINTSY